MRGDNVGQSGFDPVPVPILPPVRTSLWSTSCYTGESMRILGIDCGGEYTGYGVVEQDDRGALHHLCSGADPPAAT